MVSGLDEKHAAKNQLAGWVRNRKDGTVEAVFQGRVKDVETMLEVCKVGPPAADVKEIVTKEISSEKFVGFHQLSTI